MKKLLILAILTLVAAASAPAQEADKALLEELIRVSASGHAFYKTLPDFIKPEPPPVEKVAERFDPVLAANTKLTRDQKAFLKEHYAELGVIVNDKATLIAMDHFHFGEWLTARLRDVYPKELTPKEMREWINYFKTPQGKKELEAVLTYPPPEDPENDRLVKKFSESPIGVKYMRIFGDDLSAYMDTKIAEAAPGYKEASANVFTPEELNSVAEKFVAER